MSSQLVSVIIPVWNASAFIEETIRSALAQTYKRWEIVAVDDGSTDDSLALLEKLAMGDPRIRVFQMPSHSGSAAAVRNFAVENASGELVAFLDADDIWFPEKLELQVDALARVPHASAVASWISVFGDPERTKIWQDMMWRSGSPAITASEILDRVPETPTVVMRRSVYREMGGMVVSPKLRAGEDKEFFIRLALTREFLRIPRVLVKVRVHAVGSSLSTVDAAIEARERAIIESLQAAGVLTSSLRLRMESRLHYALARQELFHGSGPFRKNLLKSTLSFHGPVKAYVILLLAWLPRGVLKRVLYALLKIRNPR
ncbi:glycosyltransferase family A protein [soil metagenome]